MLTQTALSITFCSVIEGVLYECVFGQHMPTYVIYVFRVLSMDIQKNIPVVSEIVAVFMIARRHHIRNMRSKRLQFA